MNNDSISSLINALKTAGATSKKSVVVPFSNLLKSICDVLKENNFIDGYEVIGDIKKKLSVQITYNQDGSPKITGFKRVSKLSRRVYGNKKDFRPVKSGLGIMIVSTSKGVMTGQDAAHNSLGGEVLFEAW